MAKLRLLGVTAAVLAIIAGLVWMFARTPHRQACRLPDGSELSLASVTLGKLHRFRYRNRWQDILNWALPQRVRARFPPAIATLTSPDTNAMVIWLWHRAAPDVGTLSLYCLAVGDEHGLEAPVLYRPNVSCTIKRGIEVNGWEFREWPRRTKTIHLRVYVRGSQGGLVPTAEFTISNRSRLKSPGWEPQPLPATRRTNDLRVTLLQLETGLTGTQQWVLPSNPEPRAFTHAKFELKEEEIPSGNWRVTAVTASSPWGERWQPQGWSSGWSQGAYGVDVHFLAALWLEEPAWKFRVEVTRTANFPLSELWKIKGVPVPKPKELIEMHIVTNILGIEVELTGVSGSNAFLNDRWFTGSPPYPNLHLRSPYPAENVHITVAEVVDDRGRYAELAGNSAVPSAGGRGITLKELLQGFALKIPEGAKTLEVTFAVTKSCYFEFLVRPALAVPPKASPR